MTEKERVQKIATLAKEIRKEMKELDLYCVTIRDDRVDIQGDRQFNCFGYEYYEYTKLFNMRVFSRAYSNEKGVQILHIATEDMKNYDPVFLHELAKISK